MMKKYLKKNNVQKSPVRSAFVDNKRQAVTDVHNVSKHDLLDTNNELPADFFNVDPNGATISTVDNMYDNFEPPSEPSNKMFPPINSQQSDVSVKQNVVNWQSPPVPVSSNHDTNNENDLVNELYELVGDTYLLLVNGVMVCSGPKSDIEEEVEQLVYGFHHLCEGAEIEPENICVVKKVVIKVGAFLD